MVRELNDTENSGNQEKQIRTASTRQMKREKTHLGRSTIRHYSNKLYLRRGHIAPVEGATAALTAAM